MWTSSFLSISLILFINFKKINAQDLRYFKKPQIIAQNENVDSSTSSSCSENSWSDWVELMACDKDCGGCGRRVLQRTCLSKGNCSCDGPSRKEEVCNIKVCDYPRPACCPPHNLMVLNSHFVCGPQEQSIIDQFLETVDPNSALTRIQQRSKLDTLKPKLNHDTNYDTSSEIYSEDYQMNYGTYVRNLWVKPIVYYHDHSA